jgi:hypothetical protein
MRATPVAVVSEELARRFCKGTPAIRTTHSYFHVSWV